MFWPKGAFFQLHTLPVQGQASCWRFLPEIKMFYFNLRKVTKDHKWSTDLVGAELHAVSWLSGTWWSPSNPGSAHLPWLLPRSSFWGDTWIWKEGPFSVLWLYEHHLHPWNTKIKAFSNEPFIISSLIYICLFYYSNIHNFNKNKDIRIRLFYLKYVCIHIASK